MRLIPFISKSWKGSLAIKQLAYILFFSSLITLLLASIQIFIEYRTDINEVHRQLERIGQGYLESLSSSVWKLDDDQVNVELKDALSHRDIEYLEIYEGKDLLYSAGQIPEKKTWIEKEFEVNYVAADTVHHLGALRAVASLEGTYNRMVRRILFIITTQGIKTFFVSFFILYILYRLVIRHLIDLSFYSRQMVFNYQNGNPFTLNRAKTDSIKKDELDDLVHAINKMRLQVIQDIDDIRTREARFRQTIESTMDGFCILDVNGIVQEVNEAYCRITGFKRQDLLEKPMYDFDQGKGRLKLAHIKERGAGRYEIKHKTNLGGVVDFEISATFSTSAKEELFFLFLRDITLRKQQQREKQRLEHRLRQSQKMESLGTMAGGIAHDFNNILVPILGNTEMIIEDMDEKDPFREYLGEIQSSTMRARELVKQILTFSRQTRQELRPMDVEPILMEALKLFRSTTPDTITVKTNIKDNVPQINADPTQIHQVVLNLTTNAFHAMEKTGGELSIDLEQTTANPHHTEKKSAEILNWVRLSFSDTGVGMDKETCEKIFDPFFTTKSDQKGTGLGLSMVHGIVTNSKGTIQVTSQQGIGTCFEMYFPALENGDEQIEPSSKSDFEHVVREHVLVVDDDPSVLRVETQILKRLGYSVTFTESGQQAFEIVKKSPNKFDLVITDVLMPQMSGDKLAELLYTIVPGLPVLLCTGFSEKVSKDVRSKNIQGIIFKPFVMKDLRETLRNVLDGSHM